MWESIVTPALALIAIVVSVVGLLQARRAGARSDQANALSEESNAIARRADDRAQEAADRAADTVEWRVQWIAPGQLYFTNMSPEHTAKDAKIIASLNSIEPGGVNFPWPYPVEGGQDVLPRFPLVAKFAPLGADLARALAITGPTKYLLICGVDWTSARGVRRTYYHPNQIVTLEP